MAFVGLKHPVFAPISSETSGSLPAYGSGLIVGKAMEANVSIEHFDAELYANDTLAESEKGFSKGSITIGTDDLSKEAIIAWIGSQEVDVNGQTVVKDAGLYSAPLGGFGYYRVRKKNGVRLIRAFWYFKTRWGIPSEDAKTKGDSIEWQTPKVEGDIMAADDDVESWRIWKDFTIEADAISWLNDWANIGAPADMTALNTSVSAAQALDPETYTSVSWVDVANALTEAVAVQNMDTPSQTHVDSATSLLDVAVAALVTAV